MPTYRTGSEYERVVASAVPRAEYKLAASRNIAGTGRQEHAERAFKSKRKEVRIMRYEKPVILRKASAVVLVKGGIKLSSKTTDTKLEQTVGAYEADE
jgi:hypothetical protein